MILTLQHYSFSFQFHQEINNTAIALVKKVLGSPLLTRILNMSTKGINQAKNKNKLVNKWKQARKSSDSRETVSLL